MSLDERLRSDLRTLAAPAEDSERALNAFRERAYPRRARRRIVQAIAGTLAAAALSFGVTTAVKTTASPSRGYIDEPPPGMSVCHFQDLTQHGAESGGKDDVYSFGVSTKGRPCWIDEMLRLTISRTGNTFETKVLDQLTIQGNGTKIRLRGVVPFTESEQVNLALFVSWTWTNWCGNNPQPWFVIDAFPLAKGLDPSSTVSLGHGGAMPTCVDRMKPSVMRALHGTLTGPVVLNPL